MTIFAFVGFILYFTLCQYLIEKRPVSLAILEKLDFYSFPKVLIYCLVILMLSTGIAVFFPVFTVMNILLTIFIASYLVYRYRKIIDWRTKK